MVWQFIEQNPETIFVFKDDKACITYDVDWGQVVYLVGNFDRAKDSKYNTHVYHMAMEALRN